MKDFGEENMWKNEHSSKECSLYTNKGGPNLVQQTHGLMLVNDTIDFQKRYFIC